MLDFILSQRKVSSSLALSRQLLGDSGEQGSCRGRSLPALRHLVPPDVQQLLKLRKHQLAPPTQAAGTNPNAWSVIPIRPRKVPFSRSQGS